MNFNLGVTAGLSNSSKPTLEGNKIHEVRFDGCEKASFNAKDGSGKVYDTLQIKFSNSEGIYSHTIFEPREEDMQETEGMFGKQPAAFMHTLLLIKQLIDAVNPELGKAIDEGKKQLNPNSWDLFKDLVIKATDTGKGIITKIKLIKTNNGSVTLPKYIAAYNKAGNMYCRTTCIGNNIFFSAKELENMNKVANAAPTTVSSTLEIGTPAAASDFDIDISRI